MMRGPSQRREVVARNVEPRLTAIVVHHHTPDLLAACIESLCAGVRAPDEIIVVDNDVSDAAPSQSWRTSVPVRVLAQAANPGYAASCNLGAAAGTGDVLVFLNADVAVHPGTLERCMAAIDDPGVGIVTCRLERPDGTLDHASHRGIPTPSASAAYMLGLDRLRPRSRRLGRYRMSWLDPRTDHDIEACSGAFLMIRRSVLAQAGGWDERYWFYGEDLDLCVRIRDAGYRVRYLGTTSATHVKGASSHLREPDRLLDTHERLLKRRVQQAILDSHQLFFRQHLAPHASLPERAAARTLFAVQRMRLHRGAGPGA
jgi:GT2 family glycosyltransferase